MDRNVPRSEINRQTSPAGEYRAQVKNHPVGSHWYGETTPLRAQRRAAFRTRSLDEVRVLNERMRTDLWDHLVRGQLRLPYVCYPFAQATDALQAMRDSRHFGKLVLEL
jgi:hypothetical protein